MSKAKKAPDERAPDAWLVSWVSGRESLATNGATFSGWTASHHAEPLYTLPNALRALADLEQSPLRETLIYSGWLPSSDDAESLDDVLRAVADELENPGPPPPPPDPQEALDEIHAAFAECFKPDFLGADWDGDEAIQTLVRKVSAALHRGKA